MWFRKVFAGVFAALVVMAGCGGSSSGGGSGSFESTWSNFCRDDAARDQRCGDTPREAECLAARSCFEASWRTSAMGGLLSCLVQRECGRSDDPCFDQAGRAVQKTPTMDRYFPACNAYNEQCGGSDDYCAPVAALLADAVLSELAACMSKPCSEASPCVRTVSDKIDCW
jgi:hypothetical protein